MLETTLIFQGPIFHFHDYGRKSILQMVVEVLVLILVELLESVFFLDVFLSVIFLHMVPWDKM